MYACFVTLDIDKLEAARGFDIAFGFIEDGPSASGYPPPPTLPALSAQLRAEMLTPRFMITEALLLVLSMGLAACGDGAGDSVDNSPFSNIHSPFPNNRPSNHVRLTVSLQ